MPEVTLTPPTTSNADTQVILTSQACEDGWVEALHELSEHNDRVSILKNPFHIPKNHLTLIPEQSIPENEVLTVASGLALSGKIPIIGLERSKVSYRTWEQLKTVVCKQNANVKIAVFDDLAEKNTELDDLNVVQHFPNLTIVTPCDYYETKKAVLAAAELEGPCLLRLKTGELPILTTEFNNFHIGSANTLKEGGDVTIITYGNMVHKSIEAARSIESSSLKVRIVNVHTHAPLDREAIVECARQTEALVVVEEAGLEGGIGPSIAKITAQSNPVPIEFAATGAESDIVEAIQTVITKKGIATV